MIDFNNKRISNGLIKNKLTASVLLRTIFIFFCSFDTKDFRAPDRDAEVKICR